jgi:DNA polymerase-3 subunit gamma/tau
VLEIDGASNRGIDEIRQLRQNVAVRPSRVRYKIYIIDEVHMLSKQAFNGLLKTLEEPPQHVKFFLATTEVDKVPVTVLSRCQRFDLRRIPAEKLAGHFADVARAENVEVESDALAMIASASEGSARDGLSILDQAIAHGAGAVTVDQVRDMLGLADRGRIRRLLELVLSGDASATLEALDEAHALGIDPTQLLRGLMESLHAATRAKAGAGAGTLHSAEEREGAEALAQQLGWGTIHRLWQMLLKALQDIDDAPDPREAAEMALLRLIHAADLPDPAALIARLSGDGAPAGAAAAPGAKGRSPVAQLPADFRSLIARLELSGKHQLAVQLHDQVGLVRYAPPELVLKPSRPFGGDWPRDLAVALKSVTGATWQVSLSVEPGEPSLLDQEKMAEERVRAEVLADPNVRAAMDAFPDAELESYTVRGS